MSTSPLRQIARTVVLSQPLNRVLEATLRHVPNVAWRGRIPVRDGDGVAELGDGARVILSDPWRCHVARELFWHDGELGTAQDRLAFQVAVALAREAKTFLDVGAYTGLFALAAARVNPQLKAFAYEIVGENFLLLWRNVMLNDLVARVVPRFAAVGAAAGEMKLPIEMKTGALASSVALDWRAESGVSVPIETLDHLHADIAGPVAMKIDVEGFEMEVMDGATMLLQRHKPDIVCEVLRRAKRVDDMMRVFGALGYRWLHITEHGLVPRERILADKLRRDWLLTVKTDAELDRLGLKLAESVVAS
jgi:FkbM family methyltransferase